MMNGTTLIAAMAAFAGVGVLVASVEYLQSRRVFATGGLLAWDVCRSASRFTAHRMTGSLFAPLFSEFGFVAIMIARIVAGVIMVLNCTDGTIVLTSAAFLLASCLLMNVRHVLGRDGSDQMLVLVLAAIVSYELLSPSLKNAAFAFIALQLTLCYAVSGYAKAFSPVWRSGDAIVGIFGTRCYGTPEPLRRFVETHLRRHARALCWSVIIFECTFPLIWVLPLPLAAALLVTGLLFHAGTAVMMGLNVFFWSFASGYPAVLFCYALLHGIH